MNAPLSTEALSAVLPHVLAIDHDPTVRELITDYLGRNDLRVTGVPDVRAMDSVLKDEVIDLVLLDPQSQFDQGMSAFARRFERSSIPFIIVTGRNEEADRVMGLEMGADDYLTKPVSPRELLARIRAVLRRSRLELRQGRPEGVRAYRFDSWEVNLNTRRLAATGGHEIALSNGEFNLLVALLGRSQRVLTRQQLLDLSRLHNDEIFDRSIDILIMRLRRKFETDPKQPRYIKTERGVGYVFTAPVQTIY